MTAGAASSTPTLCISTPLTDITHTTTVATGIGTPVNLPAGVTASWAANTITISGTPSAAGVFGYSIPLTGGCGTVSATGTITVTALPVTSAITGNATPACGASGIQYSVTSTVGSTYTWTVPENATIATGQGTNSIIVNFGTTNGTIIVTERNTVGCYGTPQTLVINLLGCGLDANFSGTPEEICVGGSVEFTNTSTGVTGATIYLWNFGSGATPATANEIGPHNVTYSTTGFKTVSLTITEGASNNETKVDFITVNANNTVTPPSATPTLCINTPLTAITHTTFGATGIGTPVSLPAGVTASWAANTITISGTPSAAGVFSYSIPLTGGCGTVSATGTITVTANMTAGAASSTPTLCINTPLTAITHTTTVATGIGTPVNLPAGVTASWAANTITISGTPSAAGVFGYSIPLTGGCGTVSATGTITVSALPGAAGLITGPPSFTPGTSGISYSVSPITAATSYIWSYSGTGVTIIGTGPSITLNFSISATPGTLSVFGRNSCGDGSATTLDLSPSTKTLTLTSILLEGLYNGGGTMREVSNGYAPQYPGIADRITIELHDAAIYSTIIYSVPNVNLSLNGTATVTVPAAFSGSYYITIKHRNSLETTTSSPVSFAGTTINRSFATRANVFGENLKSSGEGFYLIFGADVNQDGLVDTGDMNDVDNGSAAILIGYSVPDANGDGIVDTSDMNMVDNNSAAVVFIRIPF
jgi:PKD repeat protein